MPLFAFECLSGHATEKFVHVAADLGAETVVCACGQTMAPALSMGRGLTYFEEGRARVIWNLGPEPVTITSHQQHKQAMKRAGVEWATGWKVNKTGGWV